MSDPSLSAALAGLGAAGPRKKPRQREFQEQCALFEWARNPAVLRQHPALALLEGSMNGIPLPLALARKAKDAGMLTGSHDIRLPVARGAWIGLSVELKADKGRPTTDQLRIGALLEAEGWKVVYAWGWDEGRTAILEYLKRGRPRIIAAD